MQHTLLILNLYELQLLKLINATKTINKRHRLLLWRNRVVFLNFLSFFSNSHIISLEEQSSYYVLWWKSTSVEEFPTTPEGLRYTFLLRRRSSRHDLLIWTFNIICRHHKIYKKEITSFNWLRASTSLLFNAITS